MFIIDVSRHWLVSTFFAAKYIFTPVQQVCTAQVTRAQRR